MGFCNEILEVSSSMLKGLSFIKGLEKVEGGFKN